MRLQYAVRRPVVNEYLVRERDRRRVRDLLRVVVWVLPVAAALLTYISVHLTVLDRAYQIRVLEQRIKDLTRTERQLRLEAAYLGSPPLIEERAREELGMATPRPDQVLFPGELP
jgi:cell division protein FtsB